MANATGRLVGVPSPSMRLPMLGDALRYVRHGGAVAPMVSGLQDTLGSTVHVHLPLKDVPRAGTVFTRDPDVIRAVLKADGKHPARRAWGIEDSADVDADAPAPAQTHAVSTHVEETKCPARKNPVVPTTYEARQRAALGWEPGITSCNGERWADERYVPDQVLMDERDAKRFLPGLERSGYRLSRAIRSVLEPTRYGDAPTKPRKIKSRALPLRRILELYALDNVLHALLGVESDIIEASSASIVSNSNHRSIMTRPQACQLLDALDNLASLESTVAKIPFSGKLGRIPLKVEIEERFRNNYPKLYCDALLAAGDAVSALVRPQVDRLKMQKEWPELAERDGDHEVIALLPGDVKHKPMIALLVDRHLRGDLTLAEIDAIALDLVIHAVQPTAQALEFFLYAMAVSRTSIPARETYHGPTIEDYRSAKEQGITEGDLINGKGAASSRDAPDANSAAATDDSIPDGALDHYMRLKKEIDALGDPAKPFPALDLSAIPWLRACMSETLRILPPVPTLERTLQFEVVVREGTEQEVRIPAGQHVVMDTLTGLGHAQSIWGEEASGFNPEKYYDDVLKYSRTREQIAEDEAAEAAAREAAGVDSKGQQQAWARQAEEREAAAIRGCPHALAAGKKPWSDEFDVKAAPFGTGPRRCPAAGFAPLQLYCGAIGIWRMFDISYDGDMLATQHEDIKMLRPALPLSDGFVFTPRTLPGTKQL